MNFSSCMKCGKHVGKDDKFCWNCGDQFGVSIKDEDIVCPKCNTSNKVHNKYCIECGHRFVNKLDEVMQMVVKEAAGALLRGDTQGAMRLLLLPLQAMPDYSKLDPKKLVTVIPLEQ